jgi:hypothetical protein
MTERLALVLGATRPPPSPSGIPLALPEQSRAVGACGLPCPACDAAWVPKQRVDSGVL